MTDFQTSEDDILLDRAGTSLKIDYKLGPHASLFTNILYNNFRDRMAQHKQRLRRQNGTAVSPDDLVTILTNGRFDYDPDRANWLSEDPTTRFAATDASEITRQRIYMDVGTMDEFGFARHYANLVDVNLHYNTEWTADPNLDHDSIQSGKSYGQFKHAHLTVLREQASKRKRTKA